MEYRKFLTIKEAAYVLGVSPLTLRNWDKNGKFPAQRHPMNNYRVYKTDVLLKIIEDIESGTTLTNVKNKIKKLSVRHLDDSE
jgi:MerR family transcriptional regulator, copper efflux regulator